ncbi:MAG: sodium:proton antiporter [Rubrobacteraceae bacterium]
MTFIISLAISIVFGAGAFLILQRNLIRLVVGIVLISNAANLFVVAAGITRGRPPIYPLPENAQISDPLVQAMVLTAIVIGSSVAALLLTLSYRLYTSHSSIDLEDISRAEAEASEALDRGEESELPDPASEPPA